MSLRYAAATLLLACASVGVANAAAPETINGIAIMPGVERLSYVSDTYYGVRPAYKACVDGTKGRVADQGDCDEFTYQDGRLNKAYKALMAQLAADKQATTDAQAAQRAWLAFMQKDCAARAPLRIRCRARHRIDLPDGDHRAAGPATGRPAHVAHQARQELTPEGALVA